MRLIDADALLKKKQALLSFDGVEVIWIYDVSVAPTFDAVPAAHGRWEHYLMSKSECRRMLGKRERDVRDDIRCSNCKAGLETELCTPYCPNCGARMDEMEGKLDAKI